MQPAFDFSTRFEDPKPPNLCLEESERLGQYNIQSYGGPFAASSVTLDSYWRPIEIPGSVIEPTELPSPDSETTSIDVQKQLLRKTAGRFRAWIKRSGKRLVVRFQNRSQTKNPEFTDIHFTGYEKAELACTPSSQLFHDAWFPDYSIREVLLSPSSDGLDFNSFEELPDNSKSVSELPDSPAASELPTAHDYAPLVPRIDITAPGFSEPPARLLIPGSRPPSLTFSAVSPAGTVTSNFSSTETAVSALDIAEPSSGMDRWSTVARGLSIVGSVKYRCDSDQDMSKASPTELVQAARPYDVQSRASQKLERHAFSGKQRKLLKTDGAISKTVLPASTIPEISNGEQDSPKREPVAEALEHKPEVRPLFRSISTRLIYKQDLHITAAVTQSATVTAQTHCHEDGLAQRFKGLLENRLPQSSSTVEPCSTESNPIDSSSIVSSASERVTTPEESSFKSPNREAVLRDTSTDNLQQKNTLDPINASSLPAEAPTDQLGTLKASSTALGTQADRPEATEEILPEKALSPISPLTEAEYSTHQSSVFSPLDPVTPVTPKVLHEKGLDSQESRIEASTVEHPSTPDTASDSQCCTTSQARPASTLPSSDAHTSNADVQAAQAHTRLGSSLLGEGPPPNDTQLFGTSFLPDFVDYQRSNAPLEETPVPPLGLLTDDKIPAKYKNTRIRTPVPQIDTTVAERSPPTAITPETESSEMQQHDFFLHTGRAEPQQAGNMVGSCGVIISALTKVAIRSASWLQRHYGEEPAVPDGYVRVRWKCNCGDHLYDDFKELRPGAASLLEARLNRHAVQPYSMPRSGSRSSSASFRYTPNSSSQPTSSATSISSSSIFETPSRYSFKRSRVDSEDGTSREREIYPYQGSRYLLTCVSEAKNTPKLSQLKLHKANILTDKDLAIALRSHYASVNQSWYRKLRLRGLTSIEFVQFYKHRNNFADIRKCPDVPPSGFPHDYEFDPSDVLPPVGPHYLVHLFKHPHEYDDEKIAYLSIPKKANRLDGGVGWGIQLTEGFLPERIWLFIIALLVLFGCIFALVWAIKMHDIQGAFGVASFVTALVTMGFGFAQACLG